MHNEPEIFPGNLLGYVSVHIRTVAQSLSNDHECCL
jgi:hypothetical protein